MKSRKTKFSELENNMGNEEKKSILGGVGATNKMDQAGPDNDEDFVSGGGGGFGLTGFGQGPFISGSANNSAELGSYGKYTYNSGFYNFGSYGGGSSNSGSSSSSNYNSGWGTSSFGFSTNDPESISRYFDFFYLNNAAPSGDQISLFVSNELSVAGRQQNNLSLYGTIELKNVNVVNNYIAPNAIGQGLGSGVLNNNGFLEVDPYYNSNTSVYTVQQGKPVPAKLTNFTKEQLVKGFDNIKFTEISRPDIVDWDPSTKSFNYKNMFQSNMKLNVDGAAAIALYENLSLSIYDYDSNKGQNATIGFGHLLHKGAIREGDLQSITFDQAVSFFASDIIEIERGLNQKIENMDLTGVFNRNQYFALVDMAYNAGIGSEKDKTIAHNVLVAMQSGGISAANKIMENSYLNNKDGGLQDRRYFQAQAFVNGRSITPEQANEELIKLKLK